MEDSFIKTGNITYDRYVFFSSQQQKRDSVENFYGRLVEQSVIGNLGEVETTVIRDTFILNLLNILETQKELLKETMSPSKTLKKAIHIKMGGQYYQKINQKLITNTQSVNIVKNFQKPNRTKNCHQKRQG